jgi:glutamate-1-semialdehyde 2,1-aminomutase
VKPDYSAQLHRVIPGGAHTYSRGDDQYPSNAPRILERGKGAYVWTPEEEPFLDYGMGLRAVTLGYANEQVNEAACKQIENGVSLTRASLIELEAAELITSLIPSAEMVKFAKHGSNVTTAAVKVARAYTGRRFVCIPRQHPFFSFDDWFIGTTPIKRGTLPDHAASSLLFDYGDIQSLEKLFNEHPGQIAAVMLEPATTIRPCAECGMAPRGDGSGCVGCTSHSRNFLVLVRDLAHRHGALFILDEMITGFRWDLRGAQHYYGVDPDLSTFGKGMANGFAVAALVGHREFMRVGAINEPGAERTFLVSTTHGGEMPGMGAFVAAVNVYETEDVVNHLWNYGRRLFEGLTAAAAHAEVSAQFVMDGNPIAMNFVTRDASGQPSLAFRTLFMQEMIRRGVLMPWIAVSLAHGDHELKVTLEAAVGALEVYSKALEEGVDRYLEGPAVKPVFRRYN